MKNKMNYYIYFHSDADTMRNPAANRFIVRRRAPIPRNGRPFGLVYYRILEYIIVYYNIL